MATVILAGGTKGKRFSLPHSTIHQHPAGIGRIGGYAPVTNLYSSALGVGWGAVALCLVLERYFRNGIGSAAGGVRRLLVAQHLLARLREPEAPAAALEEDGLRVPLELAHLDRDGRHREVQLLRRAGERAVPRGALEDPQLPQRGVSHEVIV